MSGEGGGQPPKERRAWPRGRTWGSQARGQARGRVMPGKGQDGRVGQGWGPEGWPGGGTGSGRCGLGAAKPACTHSSSCRAACPCLQAEPCARRGRLGITLEPRAGQPWSPQQHCHHAAPLEPALGGCGPRCGSRGEGEPRGWQGMDGRDLGTGGKGQDWGSPCPFPAHCTDWSAGVFRDRDGVHLPVKRRCPPPCQAPLPTGTAGLAQSATPQPSARHGPGAHCPGMGRSREPPPRRRLPAEASGRAGRGQRRPQIPRGDTGTRKGEIAPFQQQAAGQKWVQPFNPVAETPSSHGYGTSPSTPPCPALCVGPTSTGRLPAAVSPCPAPHALLPQLLSRLLPQLSLLNARRCAAAHPMGTPPRTRVWGWAHALRTPHTHTCEQRALLLMHAC